MKILVNGVEKALQFDGQPLSFDGVAVLAGRDRAAALTVEWEHKGAVGSVQPAQVISVANGMRFNVRTKGD